MGDIRERNGELKKSVVKDESEEENLTCCSWKCVLFWAVFGLVMFICAEAFSVGIQCYPPVSDLQTLNSDYEETTCVIGDIRYINETHKCDCDFCDDEEKGKDKKEEKGVKCKQCISFFPCLILSAEYSLENGTKITGTLYNEIHDEKCTVDMIDQCSKNETENTKKVNDILAEIATMGSSRTCYYQISDVSRVVASSPSLLETICLCAWPAVGIVFFTFVLIIAIVKSQCCVSDPEEDDNVSHVYDELEQKKKLHLELGDSDQFVDQKFLGPNLSRQASDDPYLSQEKLINNGDNQIPGSSKQGQDNEAFVVNGEAVAEENNSTWI